MSDVRETAARALRAAEGDEAEAVVASERSGLARFATSEVHQPTLIENVTVFLRIVRDGRSGAAMTNRIDANGLREVAARAREAADGPASSRPGLTEPRPHADVGGCDDAIAELGADELARLARAAIEVERDVDMYGFVTAGVTELAVASTTGVDAHQRMTDATALVIAAGERASGYANQTTWRGDDFDPASVGREAAEKAARTRGASSLEPAPYRAVLEPYAIADLLGYFAFDSFGALGLVEERSYFTGRIGQRVFDESVSIADDGTDARGLPKAFDFEGVPKQRVQLVDGGVARDVVWDRETAARADDGHDSTGHAPPPLTVFRNFGPLAFNIVMEGGDAASVDELCELVGDGIYVTRLHYLGIVNPREGVLTGMTRDGTFRIRGGKIAEPLVNLRFTVAVPRVLGEVPGITREPKLCNATDFYGERYPVGTVAPAVATTHFNITGVGSEPGL